MTYSLAVAAGCAAINYLRLARAETGRSRAAMAIGFTTTALWAFANAVYVIADLGTVPPLRTIGNVCSVVAALSLPIGLQVLAPLVTGAERFRRFIDVATVAGATFALTWIYVLAPVMDVTGDGMQAPPRGSGVSAAGDLGYVYGEATRQVRPSAPTEQGGYLRIWRRAGDGRWQLALDLTITEPPAAGGESQDSKDMP